MTRVLELCAVRIPSFCDVYNMRVTRRAIEQRATIESCIKAVDNVPISRMDFSDCVLRSSMVM